MAGRIVSYDPEKSRNYKELVKLSAFWARPKELLSGEIRLQVDFFLPIPKRFSQLKRRLALEGKLRPTKKPDNSNVVKGIEDALNKVIWEDDSHIVTLIVRKWYSDKLRTIIQVSECPVEQPPVD